MVKRSDRTMVLADTRQQLPGLSLALMALLLALAANVGVGTMVASFRATLPAGLISASSATSTLRLRTKPTFLHSWRFSTKGPTPSFRSGMSTRKSWARQPKSTAWSTTDLCRELAAPVGPARHLEPNCGRHRRVGQRAACATRGNVARRPTAPARRMDDDSHRHLQRLRQSPRTGRPAARCPYPPLSGRGPLRLRHPRA